MPASDVTVVGSATVWWTAHMTDEPDAVAADGLPAKRVGLRPGSMTDEHKKALEDGRARGRKVRAYLEALERSKPKPGRPITREGLQKRIDELGPRIAAERNALDKLALVQKKIDLEQRLADLEDPIDMAPLEDDFVEVAVEYSRTRNISVEAWLEMKVPRSVLKRAGML